MSNRHVPVAALRERKQHTITLTIPIALHKQVTEKVEEGLFSSMSDFYRSAARRLLEAIDGRN